MPHFCRTLFLLAGTIPVAASVALADGDHPWAVSVSAASATPAVLPGGLALGTLAELQWRDRGSPWFVAGRIGWSLASGANDGWAIDHHQTFGAAGTGVMTTLGVARIWTEVGGGLGSVYEILSRPQRQRLEGAGIADATRTTLTFGPYGFGEIGLAVQLRGPFAGVFAGGPTITRTNVAATAARWRWGGTARLGVAADF